MTEILKNVYPQKRITRFCWTVIVTTFIIFWTYFLYTLTRVDVIIDYHPLAFPPKDEATLFTNHIQSDKETNTLLSKIDQKILNNEEKQVPMIADITVVIQATTQDKLLVKQLNAILSQSMQPKSIYILCNDKYTIKEKAIISNPSNIPIHYIHVMLPIMTKTEFYQVRDASWLLTHQLSSTTITTEYTWFLEPKIIPEKEYIYHTYSLLKSKEYQSTLIGYQAANFNHKRLECFQTDHTSRQVDMIHGSWFLRTTWIDLLRKEVNANALNLPLAYFISNSLFYRANIDSILIPSKLTSNLSPSFCSSWDYSIQPIQFQSVLPIIMDTQLILQKNRLVIILAGYTRAFELMPLVCRLVQHKQIHVILIDGLSEIMFHDMLRTIQCLYDKNEPIIHDFSTAYNGINQADSIVNYIFPVVRLLQVIQAQVIIQIKDAQNSLFYREIETATQVMNMTTISLPMGQVNHVLWISDLPIEALRRWHDIKLDLVVITDRRPEPLSRLLDSLNNAIYLGDNTMDLTIHMEQSSDRVTHQLVERFDWKYGTKQIRHRIRKGGLMPAIVESWYPSDNDHYGLILEDDIELSPFFYTWTKYNILKYRYSSQRYPSIYGISLYSPRNLELLPEGRRPFDPSPILESNGYHGRTPYATQIPCSWGAIYFPEHWKMFHAYLTERIEKEDTWKGYYNITVPGSRSSNWKKSWKKYFIELTYLRAYIMIYPNFKDFESFSTNHLEYGTHVKNNSRTASKVSQFMVPLMKHNTILDQLPDKKLPTFDQLPIMDLWGRVKTLNEIVKVAIDWHPRISACKRMADSFDPSDILCPFEENILKANKAR